MSDPFDLPSPREALRNAVQSARAGDVRIAAVWLDIARELRLGSTKRVAPCSPEPCQPIGCDNGYHIAGCWYADLDDPVEKIGEPIVKPRPATLAEAPGADQTLVMRQADHTAVFAPPCCDSCGELIVWATPGVTESAAGKLPSWTHDRTGNEECDFQPAQGPRNYATPRVDARG